MDVKLDYMRHCKPEGLEFATFSCEEIKRLSVVKIITPLSFNALGHPLPGGLYDLSLGPSDNKTPCWTCSFKQIKCPGHFGHIELPLPVINPLYHRPIHNILKISCLSCYKILIPEEAKLIFIAQTTLVQAGYLVEAQELDSKFSRYQITVGDEVEKTKLLVDPDEVDEYVESVLENSKTKMKEWKGEGDYRNQYIRDVLQQLMKVSKSSCPFCQGVSKKVVIMQNKILMPVKVEVARKFKKKATDFFEISENGYCFVTPTECNNMLTQIYNNEPKFMECLLPMLSSTLEPNVIDSLFMHVVPVTPVNARPVNFVNETVVEHPQNLIYKAILNDCLVLKSVIHLMNNELDTSGILTAERQEVVQRLRGETYAEKLQFAWQELQSNINTLLDVDMKKLKTQGLGIKQIIEKKEGIIRMNMMGKRVNFAARTVITPDPNLNVDEIGIPEAFAKKLTYPVPVTVWNVGELRKLVINGPDIHPGANFLESEDGMIVKLHPTDLIQRAGVAKRLLTPGDVRGVKILHRHLHNGDILLLNRQPTLHKPSIMAHRARILKGEKTFRLHYANCKSYNADFDGDEMNAHFPQNEIARSEGYNLVSVCKQYLVPKDGTPLSGLIQDHMISGVKLTIRGRFFTRDEYMQLVFQGLSFLQGDIKMLPPCILKPAKLWSGKQVVSTVIINVIPRNQVPINLTSTSKIPSKAWETETKSKMGGPVFKNQNEMSEAEVIIRNGELLCGVLDKMHYGATPYSLVHCFYELYGGEISTRLLSSLAKLFTAFLQMEGFTLGVADILVVKHAERKRREIIKKVRKIGDQVVSETLDLPADANIKESLEGAHKRDATFRNILDHQYKVSLDSYTNEINKICLAAGLLRTFPKNNLQLMVQSGAKGSTVNTMQISCLLGQIELEGKRPPLMASGRSLPSFPPYDSSPRAGGFVDGRFMTGIQPQEFFFHCMAGREGLIDTAVKTSRSGYLQRCLVKHLEGLTVNYDMTVRDSDGSVIQFLYGEDGHEVTKCQFLKSDQLAFLANNINAIYDQEMAENLKNASNSKGVHKINKSVKRWYKKSANDKSNSYKAKPFTVFSNEKSGGVDWAANKDYGRTVEAENLCRTWAKMNEEEKLLYQKQCKLVPDPVNSKYQPDRHFGSVSEKLDQMIENYLKTSNTNVDPDMLRDMVHLKSQSALCAAGEPVGLLAAQSIGEPSTQMTLNTFHFAGRGDMNVTLGIPRLREILMVATKNIKTPSMQIPFRKDAPKLNKRMDKLRRQLTKVTVADVLEKVEVTEKLDYKPVRRFLYTLKMHFLPHEAYRENTTLTSTQILDHIENKFIKNLVAFINQKTKKKKEIIDTEKESATRSGKEDDDGDDKGADEPTQSEERGKNTKGKKRAGVGDDYESSDEEPENDDDDATTERRRARQNEEQQYSDLEDEDEEVRAEIENSGKTDKEDFAEEETKGGGDASMVNQTLDGSLRKSINVLDYKYDTIKHQWCEMTIVFGLSKLKIDLAGKLKEFAHQSVITQVGGIKRAFVSQTPEGDYMLKTDGQNLKEMYKHSDLLNLNRLFTNDIHAMAETYGIEAATKVLVKEVQDVFKVYGITVDPRHLSLVADYMTFYGTYRPLSRKGLDGSSSPLQQMSFESSLGFLRSSVIRTRKDDLTSPSARLMVGQPVGVGTAAFNLLHSISV